MKSKATVAKSVLPLSTIIRRTIWIAMLPLVFLAIGMACHEVLVIQRDMEAQAATIAENAIASIDIALKTRIDALNILAESPLLQDRARWEEFHREAQGFYRSFRTHLVVTDGKIPEQLLINTRVEFGVLLPVLTGVKGRQSGPIAMQTGATAVSDLFNGPVAQEPLLAIAVPTPGKDIAGRLIIGTTIPRTFFQDLVNRISAPFGWSLVLTDSVGDTIASNTNPTTDEASAKIEVVNSTLAPWKLTVSIPKSAYWQPIEKAIILLIAAILGGTFLGYLGGNLTGRRLRRSVAQIAEGPGPFDVQEVLKARQKIDEAREALRESEEQLRVLTQNLVSAVALINEHGEITVVNKAFVRLFNLAEDADILNVNSRDWGQWQVFDEAGRLLEVDEHPVRKAALTRTAVRDMLVAVQCPGCADRRWMLVSAEPILDANGKLHRLISTYHEITDRKQVELSLRRSEARWNAAIESFAEGVIIATAGEDVIYWNPAARDMHGIAQSGELIEPLENTPRTFELWTPDGAHKLELDEWPMRRIKRGERVRNLELRIRRLDQGWEKVFSYSGVMVDTASGERLIFLTCTDLTELRRAEESLRQSQQRYAAIHDHSAFTIALIRRSDNVFIEVNEAWEKLTGCPRDKGIGKTPVQLGLVTPESQAKIISEIQQKAFVRNWEMPFRTMAGEERLGSFNFDLIELGGVKYNLGTAIDITDRKLAEAALHESEQQLRLATEVARIGAFDLNFQTGLNVWTPEEEKMHGLAPGEFDRTLDSWEQLVHPEDRAHAMATVDKSLRTGEPVEHDYRVIWPDGSVHWLTGRFQCFKDTTGKPGRLTGVNIDITDRKRAVEELLRSKQAIEQFALHLQNSIEEERKRIARELHDEFGQTLSATKMDMSWIKRHLPPGQDQVESKLRQVILQTNSLIQSVKMICVGLRPHTLDHLGLNAALQTALKAFEEGSGVAAQLDTEIGDATVSNEIGLTVFRVVQEALRNIRQHANATEVRVSLTRSNSSLVMEVEDNGCGMPIQPSKPTSFGITGMRERIASHGGAFSIGSGTRGGTLVRVELPLSSEIE